jgi:hypothetical protein
VTTVATDGRTMAADGMSRDRGGLICSLDCPKMRRLGDGRIVGMAGTPYDLDAFCDWLEKGGDIPEFDPDNFDPLVLETDGSAWSYNHRGRRSRQLLPTGVGSGINLAVGAMEAGASPEEAVAIAIRRHNESGGTVTVLHLTA